MLNGKGIEVRGDGPIRFGLFFSSAAVRWAPSWLEVRVEDIAGALPG